MPNQVLSLLQHEYIFRDVKKEDLEHIVKLGNMLNTVNLPGNENELKSVIARSEQSFSLALERQMRSFLFVLTAPNEQVIGTSQIFAKHGTLDSPNIFFHVSTEEKYSATLKKYFRHQILRLRHNYDGESELGSLVLDNEYRSSNLKLGRNLSYVRFLFIAMQRESFQKGITAELLPPLGDNFESALWEALGRKFTGLDYYEADILSRQNKEFIRSLFPHEGINASLLPETAQEVIGQVGHRSRGAAHLLARIGFTYNNCIDPFDGGPHFAADIEKISLFKGVERGIAALMDESKEENENLKVGLVGAYDALNPSGLRFRAAMAPYHREEETGKVYLHPLTFKALFLTEQTPVTLIDEEALAGEPKSVNLA